MASPTHLIEPEESQASLISLNALTSLQSGAIMWKRFCNCCLLNIESMGSVLGKNNVETANPLEVIEAHEGDVNCIAVSEDETILVTGSQDKTTKVWTLKTEKCECIRTLRGHTDYITCVFIEDIYVITGSGDSTIRKWNMGTCACEAVMVGHKLKVNRLLFTGELIYSASSDSTVRCWDFDSGNCLNVFEGHGKSVIAILYIPNEESSPETLDDQSPRGSMLFSRPASLKSSTQAVGDILISGSMDSTARSWCPETGRLLKKFVGHRGPITCMETDKQGVILFTGSADTYIRSWDIHKGTVLRSLMGHEGIITALYLSNKILYSASADQTARSWLSNEGSPLQVYRGHSRSISKIICYKGMVYTACGDAVVRCFDSYTGFLRSQFIHHQYSVSSIQVIESDARLFSASLDGTVCAWNINSMKPQVGHVSV